MASVRVSSESGFGFVEVMLGATVLAVALMGSAGAFATAFKVANDTIEANRANDAALTVVENFRASCSADFDTALTTYSGLHSKVGNYSVTSEVILDETRFSPPLDLNGDGDTDDTALTPAEVNAVYIAVKVKWGNGRSISIVDLLARSEVLVIGAADPITGPTTGIATVALLSSSVSGDGIAMTLGVAFYHDSGEPTVVRVAP